MMVIIYLAELVAVSVDQRLIFTYFFTHDMFNDCIIELMSGKEK